MHPSWVVPGGVNAPMAQELRDRILAGLPKARAMAAQALDLFKGVVDSFPGGDRQLRHRAHHVRGPGGRRRRPAMVRRPPQVQGRRRPDSGRRASTRAITPNLSARPRSRIPISRRPTSSRIGYPAGVYRVGPLARLNVAEHFGTPAADRELAEFHQRCGAVAHSSFHYHYARLIELLHALEKIEVLAERPRHPRHARALPRPRELPGRRRHDRSPARRADPPLQSGRAGRHASGPT